jgi:hypothetical protein
MRHSELEPAVSTVNVTTAILVASNLVPLAGVLWFEWTVFEVLLLFWFENLVIGAINVARLWTLYERRNHGTLLLFIPFFCVHYGTFALAHLTLLISVFRPEDPDSYSLTALIVPLALLVASHAYSHYVHFLGRREYLDVTPAQLMVRPYARVVALHVAVLVGGGIVQWLGEPAFALVILVLIKIAFDVPAHRQDHRDSVQREGARSAQASRQEPVRDAVFKGWSDDEPGSGPR